LLLVDATQAFGAFPVALAPADYLVASTFKWALAAHGAAVFAAADSVRDCAPAFVGWRGIADLFEPIHDERYTLRPDARRFEEGMPGYGALYTLEATLGLLESMGAATVETHIRARVRQALDGYAALGIETLASAVESERAGIVAFETPNAAEIAARLAADDVYVWGRDGRLRISPHVYTAAAGIDRFLARLAGAVNERPGAYGLTGEPRV
jgi:selenocysteine lyase/cysteine desulfurase